MQIKTIDLTGAALDWAVATAEAAYAPIVDTDIDGTKRINYGGMYPEWSTDWSQGGPIIEREKITPEWTGENWMAYIRHDDEFFGPTPLIAAMRCYVASVVGDTVTVPDELCN